MLVDHLFQYKDLTVDRPSYRDAFLTDASKKERNRKRGEVRWEKDREIAHPLVKY